MLPFSPLPAAPSRDICLSLPPGAGAPKVCVGNREASGWRGGGSVSLFLPVVIVITVGATCESQEAKTATQGRLVFQRF